MKVNNLYYNKREKAQQLIRSVWAHTVTMEHGALLKGYYKDTDFPQFVAGKLIEEEEYSFSGGTHCRPYDKVFPGIRRMIEDMVTIFMAENPGLKTIEISDCLLFLEDKDLHRMILFGVHPIGTKDLCDMNQVRGAAELIRFILSNYDTE